MRGGFNYGYNGGSAGSDAKLGGTGGTVGLHGGYNFQIGKLILGAEADISWVNAKSTGTGLVQPLGTAGYGSGYASAVNFGSKINALSTVRARLGFDLTGSTMVYATAGFAAANVKNYWSGNLPAGYGYGATISASGSKSGWKSGYVIGGGVEHKLTDRILLKAELDWVKLDGQTFRPLDQQASVSWGGGGTASFGAPGSVRFADPELVIGKIGISYKF